MKSSSFCHTHLTRHSRHQMVWHCQAGIKPGECPDEKGQTRGLRCPSVQTLSDLQRLEKK